MSYYGMTDDEKKDYIEEQKRRKKKLTGAITAGSILVVLLIIFFLCSETIKPGYSGVVYNANGGLETQVLGQGFHFVAPWKSITAYPVSTETIFMSKAKEEGSETDESFDITTSDGKPVNVDVSNSYHYDVNKLPAIFTKFRGAEAKTIEGNYIRRSMKSAINNISSTYGVMEVYGEKRSELQLKVFELFRSEMEKEGIIIESFNFLAIRPDEQSMKAIQAKVDAMQKLEQSKIEQQQAEITAETARVNAKGESDAALIKAQGQAKANEVLKQSLTPELVEYAMAQKWNGQYPTVMGGNTMLQMPLPGASK
jgi:regulator of protease activity HflC (stomatin/prohibitin superfamily)